MVGISPPMTMPLALICFENLVRANQLLNKLRDQGYRTREVGVQDLGIVAETDKPFLILLEIVNGSDRSVTALRQIRETPATSHIPVLVVTAKQNLSDKLLEAGATLVASDTALLDQLPHLLNHILEVE